MATEQSQGNNTQPAVAQVAREAEYARNLQRAQQQQQKKQQHTQKVASDIKSSKYNAPQKTDAQKKQALQGRQRWHARMMKARKKKKRKKKLSKKYKKIIKKYNRTLWILLYVAAFADAIFDVLSIPLVSTVASFCTSLYITVVLWKAGRKKDRQKKRITRTAILLLDLIPIINIIPFSVIIVYRAQEDAKKRMKSAKKALKKISKL